MQKILMIQYLKMVNAMIIKPTSLSLIAIVNCRGGYLQDDWPPVCFHNAKGDKKGVYI